MAASHIENNTRTLQIRQWSEFIEQNKIRQWYKAILSWKHQHLVRHVDATDNSGKFRRLKPITAYRERLVPDG